MSPLEKDLAEARRELADTRAIWREKRDELQSFIDGLAVHLSGAVADTTRAKDRLAVLQRVVRKMHTARPGESWLYQPGVLSADERSALTETLTAAEVAR